MCEQRSEIIGGIGGIAGIYVGHDTDLASIKDSNFYGELITNLDIVNGGIIGHSRDGDEADNIRIENCNYKGTNVNVNIPTSTT